MMIEFDGTTVLCSVCGDKASGFHYGVHSCEGCKGFFRRSIQQKIQYRPCTKNQQCSILRINRNRCQYCRLKKCIAVGMSRDAVRFGRVPKREKAKILEAMQKVNQNSQEKQLAEQLDNEAQFLNDIVEAHLETSVAARQYVGGVFSLLLLADSNPNGKWRSQMACPLASAGRTNSSLSSSSVLCDIFNVVTTGVVDFAKRLPGFAMLSQDDQVTLLKAGVFEVLLVRLSVGEQLVDNNTRPKTNFLVDSMFDFAERLTRLCLTDNELALFTAIILMAPDRHGLRNIDLVHKIHTKLSLQLQKISPNFEDLMKKIPDLRTLNTLHSEKLLGYRLEESAITDGGADSSTDSGIESSKEVCSTTTSMCSSPRSTTRSPECDVSSPDNGTTEHPILKRALQAPPIVDTTRLMEEAYKHRHKKFRPAAVHRQPTPPVPTTPIANNLVSSHSMLVKTLEQRPAMFDERQMRQTELVHNLIMQQQQVSPADTIPPTMAHGQPRAKPISMSADDDLMMPLNLSTKLIPTAPWP